MIGDFVARLLEDPAASRILGNGRQAKSVPARRGMRRGHAVRRGACPARNPHIQPRRRRQPLRSTGSPGWWPMPWACGMSASSTPAAKAAGPATSRASRWTSRASTAWAGVRVTLRRRRWPRRFGTLSHMAREVLMQVVILAGGLGTRLRPITAAGSEADGAGGGRAVSRASTAPAGAPVAPPT